MKASFFKLLLVRGNCRLVKPHRILEIDIMRKKYRRGLILRKKKRRGAGTQFPPSRQSFYHLG